MGDTSTVRATLDVEQVDRTTATNQKSLGFQLRRFVWFSLHPARIGRRGRRRRRRRQQRNRLLGLMPAEGTCAEIGSWHGDFAATILKSRNPKQLYLVDPWEYRSEEDYQQSWYAGSTSDGQKEMDEAHDSVVERFRSEIQSGQVIILRDRSLRAAESFADESLDWIYIDGDHTYEGVRADLEAFYPKIKPGGFLTGDDYVAGRWWGDGVIRAVDEFANRCEGRTIIGTQFLMKKPHSG